MTMLNYRQIEDVTVQSWPYRYFHGDGLLTQDAIPAIDRDFPNLKSAGYLTLRREFKPQGAFAELIDELTGPHLSIIMSQALGLDLTKSPTLVTVMRQCPMRAGRIHTDGESKLATLLLYFNRTWDHGSAGAIRVLLNDADINDAACEVSPLMGNFFGFRRCDHSWHGHLPYKGERRVVQLTWLDSEEALDRKQRNNAFAQALKAFFPRRAPADRPGTGAS